MLYKNSLRSAEITNKYEIAMYIGNFTHGRRDGKGMMVWSDGTTFRGTWKDDMRKHGTLIMSSNQVYVGSFVKDLIHGPNEMLLTPGMPIYKGQFTDQKTAMIGLLMYNDGSMYFG